MEHFWLFVIIFCIPWVVILLIKKAEGTKEREKAEQERLNTIRRTMGEIDSMDGLQFEKYIAKVLIHEKYTDVMVTKSSGDFGVDIVANKNGEKYAFQCKNYSRPLGVKPIQEVYSGAKMYAASVKVVVTNNYFTSHAITLANELNVQLWDRSYLMELCAEIPANDGRITYEGLTEMIVSRSQSIATVETVTDEQSVQPYPINFETPTVTEDYDMATTLGAGKYIFGVNIPMGMYNLKAISGEGMLHIYGKDSTDDYDWLDFGITKDCAKEYNGLSLKEGQYFTVDGSVRFEISKAKMIEIE